MGKNKKKKGISTALLVTMITVIVVVVALVAAYVTLNNKLAESNFIETSERPTEPPIVIEGFYTPLPADVTPTPEVTPEPTEAPIWALDTIDSNVINLLLCGVDSRTDMEDMDEETKADSDSMMLVSCNLKTGRVVIFSLMRDGGAYLTNKNWYDKLNKAYANYGIGGLINNVLNGSRNFDLDVQNYISISFLMFIDIIDAFDGLDIELSEEECKFINEKIDLELSKGDASYMPRKAEHVEVKNGVQHLNGEQCLWYARDRYSAGLGDYGRTSRQRNVLLLLYNKVKEEGWTIERLSDVVGYVVEHAATNLDASQILQLATIALNQDFKVESTTIPFPGMGHNSTNSKGNYLLSYDMDKTRDMLHGIIYGGDALPEGTVEAFGNMEADWTDDWEDLK